MVEDDVVDGAPHGIIGGPRRYDGPGLGDGPWKCPACLADNTGPLDQGCTTCGSGSARPRHVGHPPPAVRPVDDLRLDLRPAAPTLPRSPDGLFAAWFAERASIDENPAGVLKLEAIVREAFMAGYGCGLRESQAQTMAAPPVTADVRELAPEGKPRRTIIAALELFKDQVLRDATDEIASGEWLTIEETERLIQQLKDEEESAS